MACSLSSRICSTLASIAPSPCAVAVWTASAACAATVLADSRRSVAFSADCLFVVLMMGFSLGSMWGFGGCAAVTVPLQWGRVRPQGRGPVTMARVRARISVSSSYTEPRQLRWPGWRSDPITRHTSGYLAEREPLYATPTRDSSSSGDSVSASAMHEQQNEPRSGRPEQTRHRAERQHRGLGDVEPRVGQRPAQPPLVRFIAQPSAAEQQRRLHRQKDQDRRGHQQQPGPPSAGRPGSGPAASSAAPRPTQETESSASAVSLPACDVGYAGITITAAGSVPSVDGPGSSPWSDGTIPGGYRAERCPPAARGSLHRKGRLGRRRGTQVFWWLRPPRGEAGPLTGRAKPPAHQRRR